jgi:hypothetical protein
MYIDNNGILTDLLCSVLVLKDGGLRRRLTEFCRGSAVANVCIGLNFLASLSDFADILHAIDPDHHAQP